MQEAAVASSKKQPYFLTTHVRGPKGNITHERPYRLHCVRGREFYEVPKGSGIWLNYNESPVSAEDQKKFKLDLIPKIDTPLSLDEQIAQKKALLAEMEAKLAPVAPAETKVAAPVAPVVSKAEELEKVKKQLEPAKKIDSVSVTNSKSAFASQMQEQKDLKK